MTTAPGVGLLAALLLFPGCGERDERASTRTEAVELTYWPAPILRSPLADSLVRLWNARHPESRSACSDSGEPVHGGGPARGNRGAQPRCLLEHPAAHCTITPVPRTGCRWISSPGFDTLRASRDSALLETFMSPDAISPAALEVQPRQ